MSVVSVEEQPDMVYKEQAEPRQTPWWAWAIVLIGLAEIGWIGNTAITVDRQIAAMQVEIRQMQTVQTQRTQTLGALQASTDALSVNVAVLTQRLADWRPQ